MVNVIRPYTHSTIGIIVGSAGAGKSLLLALTLVMGMIEGHQAWCNMPVKTGNVILARRYSPGGRKIEYAESKPINWDLLYKLDESMCDGDVGVDEVGYVDPARGSMGVKNRLINSCIRQARHRSLSFYGTSKSFYRLDSYLREETDWVALCTDLSFSPWGQANHLRGGEVINIKYFDISGRITGKSIYNTQFSRDWERSGRGYYKETNLHGRPYMDCYDTKRIIPIEEAFTEVQMDFKKRIVGNRKEIEDKTREYIQRGVNDFKKSGHDEIATGDFWKYMENTYQVKGSPSSLGKYLPEGIGRHWTRQGNMYVLNNDED